MFPTESSTGRHVRCNPSVSTRYHQLHSALFHAVAQPNDLSISQRVDTPIDRLQRDDSMINQLGIYSHYGTLALPLSGTSSSSAAEACCSSVDCTPGAHNVPSNPSQARNVHQGASPGDGDEEGERGWNQRVADNRLDRQRPEVQGGADSDSPHYPYDDDLRLSWQMRSTNERFGNMIHPAHRFLPTIATCKEPRKYYDRFHEDCVCSRQSSSDPPYSQNLDCSTVWTPGTTTVPDNVTSKSIEHHSNSYVKTRDSLNPASSAGGCGSSCKAEIACRSGEEKASDSPENERRSEQVVEHQDSGQADGQNAHASLHPLLRTRSTASPYQQYRNVGPLSHDPGGLAAEFQERVKGVTATIRAVNESPLDMRLPIGIEVSRNVVTRAGNQWHYLDSTVDDQSTRSHTDTSQDFSGGSIDDHSYSHQKPGAQKGTRVSTPRIGKLAVDICRYDTGEVADYEEESSGRDAQKTVSQTAGWEHFPVRWHTAVAGYLDESPGQLDFENVHFRRRTEVSDDTPKGSLVHFAPSSDSGDDTGGSPPEPVDIGMKMSCFQSPIDHIMMVNPWNSLDIDRLERKKDLIYNQVFPAAAQQQETSSRQSSWIQDGGCMSPDLSSGRPNRSSRSSGSERLVAPPINGAHRRRWRRAVQPTVHIEWREDKMEYSRQVPDQPLLSGIDPSARDAIITNSRIIAPGQAATTMGHSPAAQARIRGGQFPAARRVMRNWQARKRGGGQCSNGC